MDKKARFIEIKSINAEAKTIVAYVSTYDWDRTGEKFVKGAWRLDNYRKSPVVLWAHSYATPPIGKALSISEDDKGLKAEMQFDTQDDFAMKIFSLFQRGFMNSFSVGFRPTKYVVEPITGTNEKGIVWTDAELLEFSAVAVPANPHATMERSLAEFAVKEFKGLRIKEIEGSDEVAVEEVPKEEPPKETPEPPADASTEKPAEAKPEDPPAPPAEPAKSVVVADDTAELEKNLKSLIEIARTIKGQKIDETKLSLVKLSLTSLNEIVCENTTEVSREDFEKLKGMVQSLSEYMKARRPDLQDVFAKFMNQFELALKGYKGE